MATSAAIASKATSFADRCGLSTKRRDALGAKLRDDLERSIGSPAYGLIETTLDLLGDAIEENVDNNVEEDQELFVVAKAEISKEEEEPTDYRDSQVFLKGTASKTPHNDYAQHFIDTHRRPQNFIREWNPQDRYKDYPKLRKLMQLKGELTRLRATPPMYHNVDLRTFDFKTLPMRFDVIYIDPPLPEYQRRAPGAKLLYDPWTWQQIRSLRLHDMANTPSFVFLWVGSDEGLEEGRLCLKKWGYRRCEDICWVKTNRQRACKQAHLDGSAVLQHTKEHCLLGIKGSVKRNIDTHLIHANMDIDLIVDEERELGQTDKPDEIFDIMERFCLSRKRLHLFANDNSIRAGWLSLGSALSSSNYDAERYRSYLAGPVPSHVAGKPLRIGGGDHRGDSLVGCWPEIEDLRPKTPPNSRRRKGK
eukprot:TRINITY_DN12383_c0_g1_i8.p1 TRINITY_DN12383_c0_g1~~TRINITY_DN12383_c0_g1_i8.p1  ORF type:complete len:420 (+),score=104.78 TRINITY_DN12383_c0_g1_i8:188-1447(+)